MAIPFTVVQGTIFVADKYGNIVGTKQISGETEQDAVTPLHRAAVDGVLRGGNSPFYVADVALLDGKKKLLTDATVTVEQIFGQDDYADSWFTIVTAGAIGDTLRVQIAAYTDPTGTERSVPAVDKTITITALEAGKETVLRDKVIEGLNSDGAFGPHWKASAIKDNPIIHISSKYIAEYGERLLPNDIQVTPTGTTTTLLAYDNIRKRGKANSGARDPKDKRLVTVGISGEVTSTPGAVGDLYLSKALNAGSSDMKVAGSLGTPVNFTLPLSAVKDVYVSELRFYGNANGIKFGQFLGQNNPLTNGILVEIKSDDQTTTFNPILTTDDFKHYWSIGGGAGFQLHIQAGRDDFLASFTFPAPFPLRRIGTFVLNDYVKVSIRDNLTAGILVLECLAFGFEREV